MKTKTFFSGLLAILFLFGLANADVKYPNYVGHINDFAKILPADTVKKLETELRKYKDQTGIEIAAVTVVSLEGLSVEEYTIGLAKKWGVGSKKKDDGVVLLVAPNERKVRIEVGYGLEPDLTDSQAGRVIRDQIIPLFKEGRMADGVVAGVAGILQQLGKKPYQERLEERKNAPPGKEGFPVGIIILLIVVLAIIFVIFVSGFLAFFDNSDKGSKPSGSSGFVWTSGGSGSISIGGGSGDRGGGGGFGGFGGGGFGGGGASGSW